MPKCRLISGCYLLIFGQSSIYAVVFWPDILHLIDLENHMIKLPYILVLSLLFTWAPNAMAYIDPGSGSAIMSAIIGAFVALTLTVKTYWYKIKSFFVKKPADSEDQTQVDEG